MYDGPRKLPSGSTSFLSRTTASMIAQAAIPVARTTMRTQARRYTRVSLGSGAPSGSRAVAAADHRGPRRVDAEPHGLPDPGVLVERRHRVHHAHAVALDHQPHLLRRHPGLPHAAAQRAVRVG